VTEAAQEATPKVPAKRKSRAKDNSLVIMKELTGLMGQRTAILTQIRAKRMELAELEGSLHALGQEIQWRASVFGLNQSPAREDAPQPPQMPFPGQPQVGMTPPIFRQPELPISRDGVNRSFVDLSSLT
jgi:hypothetical protein